MARYRLSEPAKDDIVAILQTSAELHGAQGRHRYRACLTAAPGLVEIVRVLHERMDPSRNVDAAP